MIQIDVDYFLGLDLPFFEPANQRRGGWSGVSLVECAGHRYFVKRQKNHTYREWRRLWRRTPTLRREYRNLIRLRKLGLATPEVVTYAERGTDGVLVTSALEGYVALNTWLTNTDDVHRRARLFDKLTKQLLRLHTAGFTHGCLYGQHIMVNDDDIAFLDLEKLRRVLRPAYNASKDISQLFRRTAEIGPAEKQLIIEAYERRYPGFQSTLATRMAREITH